MIMKNLPLSVRTGLEPVEKWAGPFEGIPQHLRAPLIDWIEESFVNGTSIGYRTYDESRLRTVGIQLRLNLDWSHSGTGAMKSLRIEALGDETKFLNITDWCLRYARDPEDVYSLDNILDQGGSVWTVDWATWGQQHLERKVDATSKILVSSAAPADSMASVHLEKAWEYLYRLSPIPDKCFDESVKAVEAAAIPIVCPSNTKATLGVIIADMLAKPIKWRVSLDPSDGIDAVDEVIKMLNLLWKSHRTRHAVAGEGAPRVASTEEAEAALFLASTLAHWFTSGIVTHS
ncbi:MAG: hypothetical protein ACHQFZ_07050 [Acidimicrobiales bacterium]